MPYHGRLTLEQPVHYRDENVKFICVFDPTFQGPENASALQELGSVETQLSLPRFFLACVPFVLVLFVSPEQLIVSRHSFTQEVIVFCEEARPLRSLPNLVRKLCCVCATDSAFT
jgi:hypothetical protein